MEENKKCCTLGLGLALAILWAGCLALVGVINRYNAPYGREFLATVSSLYPGYHAEWGLRNLAIGVGWAFVDGFVGGVVFGWLYNLCSKIKCKCA